MTIAPEPPTTTRAPDVPVEERDDVRYAGLATRAIAFTIDAAAINLAALVVGIAAALILSLFHLPKSWDAVLAAIGAGVYVVCSIAYFVLFWSTTGQSPGARVMQIRLVSADDKPLKPRRALTRWVGVVLAVLPLFGGYVPVLFDDKRRAFPDRLAGTLVIDAPQTSFLQARRTRQQAPHDGRERPPR